MYHSLDQIMMFNPRIAKEVEHLVDSLNKTYNELSRMQADYLSMQTSDDKWGPHMISMHMIKLEFQIVLPCKST